MRGGCAQVTRSKRLKPIAEFAQSRERDAAVALARYQQIRDERERRLNELRDYRRDYISRFQSAGSQGIDAGQLQGYRVFLERLEEAVQQQEVLVATARRDYEERRQAWFSLRGRAQALDKVVARHRDHELRDEDRREQREADERSQRPNGGDG
jgi:flagellar FliJ protein